MSVFIYKNTTIVPWRHHFTPCMHFRYFRLQSLTVAVMNPIGIFLRVSLFFSLLAPNPPTQLPYHQIRETPRFSLWANAFPLDRHTEIWERNFNHISTIREVFLCCRGSLFKDSISLPSERDYRTAHLPRRDLPTAKQPATSQNPPLLGCIQTNQLKPAKQFQCSQHKASLFLLYLNITS